MILVSKKHQQLVLDQHKQTWLYWQVILVLPKGSRFKFFSPNKSNNRYYKSLTITASSEFSDFHLLTSCDLSTKEHAELGCKFLAVIELLLASSGAISPTTARWLHWFRKQHVVFCKRSHNYLKKLATLS